MVSAVIVAAGQGRRMGADINKVFLKLCDKLIIEHTLDAVSKSNVDEIVIVTSKECIDDMRVVCENIKNIPVSVVCGGSTRQESVYKGIKKACGEIVCIHDGARCLITPGQINSSVEDCKKYGAAALGVICKDTMKLADDNGYISSTVDREKLYSIQTPQVFKKKEILNCHITAEKEGINVTDDCSLFELYEKKVYITQGSYENIKLTTPEDLLLGELILKRRQIS